MLIRFCVLLLVLATAKAFVPSLPTSSVGTYGRSGLHSRLFSEGRPEFELSFEMPKKGITEYGIANMKIPPVLAASEAVVVRYRLPFGLDVAPPNDQGNCVCSKAGRGGEQPGDVLRYTTYWRGKEPGLFDVARQVQTMGAKAGWDAAVAALVSNDLSVTDEIVLVFERPTAK